MVCLFVVFLCVLLCDLCLSVFVCFVVVVLIVWSCVLCCSCVCSMRLCGLFVHWCVLLSGVLLAMCCIFRVRCVRVLFRFIVFVRGACDALCDGAWFVFVCVVCLCGCVV